MKKLSQSFMLIILSICCTFAVGCTKETDLYSLGLQMTKTMEEVVKNDFYSNYCVSSYIKEERHQFIANDYDTPIKVYDITLFTDAKTQFLKLNTITEEEWNELPESVKEQLLNKMKMPTVVTNINAKNGINIFAVANSYVITKQFEGCSIKNDFSYLYVFETGKPIMVTFSPSHNGVNAIAQFLITEKVNSLSTLRELFGNYDCQVSVLFA